MAISEQELEELQKSKVKVDKIQSIIEGTDEHRNRAKRESWEAVKDVVYDREPESITVDSSSEDKVPVDDDQLELPPLEGPGSGVTAWREFAAKAGVEVDPKASKDEVIEALAAAGIVTVSEEDKDPGD